jgi:hypothetical protein
MKKLLSLFLVRLCVLTAMFAFATSGFASQPMPLEDIEIAQALAELGLDTSDICGGDGAEESGSCGLCHLTALHTLSPAPDAMVALAKIGALVLPLPAAKRAFFDPADKSRPVRAPPFV